MQQKKQSTTLKQQKERQKAKTEQSLSTKHQQRHWLKKQSMNEITFSVQQCLEKGEKKKYCGN